MALSPKQERFACEYLLDLNATQAARRAGYSPRTANEQGSRLLANVSVAARISALQAARVGRTAVDADRVVEELSAMAFYDPADIASVPMTGPKDIAKLPASVRRAVIGWSYDKAGNFTLKLAPKTASLDMLGRHLGMFREQVDVHVTDVAALMAERRARVAARRARGGGA